MSGTPHFSVGEFTTPHLSFAQDLEVYRMAGAEGIGIDAALKLRDPVEDLGRFRESGLKATFCFPKTSTIFAGKLDRGPIDPAARVDALCEGIRGFAGFEPICCVCGTGPYGGRHADEAYDFAVRGLQRAARAAADVGLQLALEPMHSSLEHEWSFLTTLGQTVELLARIDEPNVGFLFDVWHLWDSPDVRTLLRNNLDRVLGVHVDDWRDPTRSWCDRVLPGDGVADAAGLLSILREGGYDGWLELEIFSDDGLFENCFPDSLWAQDPVQVIRAGRDKTHAAWELPAQATHDKGERQ